MSMEAIGASVIMDELDPRDISVAIDISVAMEELAIEYIIVELSIGIAVSIAILEVIAIGYDTIWVAWIAGALAIIEGAPIMSGGNIMLAQKHLH